MIFFSEFFQQKWHNMLNFDSLQKSFLSNFSKSHEKLNFFMKNKKKIDIFIVCKSFFFIKFSESHKESIFFFEKVKNN